MNFDKQRDRMVNEQLAGRGIDNVKVLEAFRSVPRHKFVPDGCVQESYEDHPLPIGEGQTISQPYIVALMTQALELKGDEKVLEVGTGSGYQAAILADLVKEVYTIEKEESLLRKAETVLRKEGCNNISFKCGDGTLGWKEKSPFEAIIVTAAAPHVPESLKEQLADGGRLVIPVGDLFSQMLTVIEKRGNDYLTNNLCGCMFVPLIGEEGWKGQL